MFISSSKTFGVKRNNGELYRIPQGFVGEVPEDVGKSLIVQLAIKEGSIKTPASKKDKDIDKALVEGAENVKKAQAEQEDAKAKEDDAKAKATKK